MPQYHSGFCNHKLMSHSLPPSSSGPAHNTPDLESRAAPEDHQDLRLWLRMLTCCNLIESELRSRLRTEYETTLPRFDLMAQLLRVPGGMKMSELSRHMMVTNGNITGITDQLEKEGLVERVKVATDRRSSLIRLTAKGKRSFRKMAQSHEEWVRTLFGGLSEKSRNNLFEALGELKLLAQPQLSGRN
ncbi:MarR-family transcriptional regulator [Pusillimonas sp. T7-7]|nr:MarR-family transcriptional regulator [Pusillimonas sp. T7-7]